MPKFSSQRRKKRKFHGNRFTSKQRVQDEEIVALESTSSGSGASSLHCQKEAEECSASFQKLVTNTQEEKPKPEVDDQLSKENSPAITGLRFCDMEVLSSVFAQLRCGDCGNFSLLLMEDNMKRKGCASTLRLLCEHCGWKHSFCTSKKQGKSYEVNRRLVYGMRTIGKGYAGARKFCAIMNMPPPPTEKAFIFNSRVIGRHVKEIAKESMKKAGQDIYAFKNQCTASEAGPFNCGVSCDGTWQKRGYSSRNGCVTVISMDTGRVLDVEALSQGCKQCERHEHLDKTSLENQTWRAEHTKCKANFRGSAPAMEPEGAERIFQRSVELHNLRYTEFYGDGDSKSFSRVKGVYEDAGIEMEKKECIGHVQKRVGTALRKLKRENPGLGGKGKLTDSQIDKLQNYYGIAIRSNVGDLAGMKKAIHASLMHCASTEARPLHDHCPTGSASWCRYQQDKANGTKLYKHGPGLPLEVIVKLKPEYIRLSEDSLLEKCLHGKTQNQNESLNGMIWQRVPKEVYVGRETLELGLYDAVSHFNIGAVTVIKLFQGLNIPPGKYTEEGCKLQDQLRVDGAEYKNKASTKKRRKVIRGLKKRKDDKNKQREGVNYASGEF